MNIEQKIEIVKTIVKNNTGKFITVDFVKKDGSIRTMQCHKSKVLEASRTGNNAEATAKRKETLKANGMLYVEELKKDHTYQYRTINLATVTRIAANGVTYSFN